MELRGKSIESPFDLAVMLIGVLRQAHYIFTAGSTECALIWDADNFDCRSEIDSDTPNILHILTFEEYRSYSNLALSDWIAKTLPQLTDTLWNSHFSQETYFTNNYVYRSKLFWLDHATRQRIFSIFPESDMHTAMMSFDNRIVPIMFSGQVDILLEEPLGEIYRLLKRGDYTWFYLVWSDAGVQVNSDFETLNESGLFADEENHITFLGGDDPTEFPLVFAMTDDQWVEHILEHDRSRHERFFFERSAPLETNLHKYRAACTHSKLQRNHSLLNQSFDVESNLKVN